MVKKVIVSFKANGKDKTLAEINALEGQFRDRDLYITVLDMQGMELAKKRGKGWQDYKFVNPVTKKIEPKSMYFEKYDDVVINCGVYKVAR